MCTIQNRQVRAHGLERQAGRMKQAAENILATNVILHRPSDIVDIMINCIQLTLKEYTYN